MRITQVHIDHFAGWEDATVDLPAADIHVLYGPNETGKSTLLRFMRGILYGFSESDRFTGGAREQLMACAGHLRVTHGGEHIVIRRELPLLSGETLRLTDEHGSEVPDSLLDELLGGVNAETFQNVFALGLPELQEMATLSTDDVVDYVYQVSLGPSGRRLLDACDEARHRRDLILGGQNTDGQLVSLAQQLAEFDEQIELCRQDTGRYAALREELQRVEVDVDDQKRRQNGLRGQLRGHEFLERVAGPWNRQQQLQQELGQLPHVAGVPEGGLERLDKLEQDISDLSEQKRNLAREARQLAKTSASLEADSRLAEHASAVRDLLQRRNEFDDVCSGLTELNTACEGAWVAAEDAVTALGEDWNEQRVEAVDDSPGTAIALFHRARRYRDLLRRRARDVRHYQRIASRLQQQQIELAQRLKPFDAADASEAWESCEEQVSLLETIASLEGRAAQQELLRDELTAATEVGTRSLPPYFFAVLVAFGILGLVLMLAGVVTVVQGTTGHMPWLVGLIFVLLGVACGGVTWTVKRHFDPDEQRDGRLKDRLQQASDELAKLQGEITRYRTAVAALTDSSADTLDATELLKSSRRRLVELNGASQDEEAIGSRRVFLSRFRERIRDTQRQAGAARREWCLALQAAGLNESVQVDPPLEQWRGVADAKRLLREYRSIAAELERATQTAGEFRTALQELSHRIDGEDRPVEDVGELLDDWEERLARSDAARRQRIELRRESRRRRRAAEQAADQISALQRQRLEHLAAAGAADRDEFRDRVEAWSRRLELEDELRIVNEELAEAAQSAPDLAVVEEDLRAFDPAGNRIAIEAIRNELEDLSGDMETSREQLGRLRQELNQLESDRRPAAVRFERAQLLHRFAAKLQDLCATEITLRALDHARANLESTHQPETLASAGSFLSRLTRGRYTRVWTRLGERQLFVDEAGCGVLDVERLSAGTREQLFLAIRLALMDRLRTRGVRLPVVLDDVLVNFDEERTDAAIGTLRDFAAAGEQVLVFTCHQHLAERFGRAGVSTMSLPAQQRPAPRRRVG